RARYSSFSYFILGCFRGCTGRLGSGASVIFHLSASATDLLLPCSQAPSVAHGDPSHLPLLQSITSLERGLRHAGDGPRCPSVGDTKEAMGGEPRCALASLD